MFNLDSLPTPRPGRNMRVTKLAIKDSDDALLSSRCRMAMFHANMVDLRYGIRKVIVIEIYNRNL